MTTLTEIGPIRSRRQGLFRQSGFGHTGTAMNNPNQDCHRKDLLSLSRDEAACALGVFAITIDRLTERGLLRATHATPRPVYPIREVERFLRESVEMRAYRGGAR